MIGVSFDSREVDALLSERQLKRIHQSMKRNVDRAVKRGHREALNIIKKEKKFAVDKEYLKENIILKKVSGDATLGYTGLVKIRRRAMSLVRLPHKTSRVSTTTSKYGKTRTQVKVKYTKGKPYKTVKGAFLGYGKNANYHIFKRKGKSRHEIRKLDFWGVWHVMKNDTTIKRVDKVMSDYFNEKFNADLDRWVLSRS